MERKKFLKQNSQNKWQKRGLEDNYFKLPFSQNILPKILRIFAKNVECAHILAYLCFMLAITVLNGRKKKQKNAEGFFLANRGVSSVLLPLTMIAAMQSTFAFLGAPGMYYTHGISYISIVLSQVWVALMVVYFGNKIRKLANKMATCLWEIICRTGLTVSI